MADYTQTDPGFTPGTTAPTDSNAAALMGIALAELLKPPAPYPGAPGVSTVPMARQLEIATKSRDEQNRLINEQTKKAEEATQREKDALTKQAEGEAELARAIQAKDQRIADGFAFYQRLFGVHPDQAALIAQLGSKVKEELPQVMDQLGKIQEMQSVGPLDNPLEWLYNTIQLPSQIQAYNRGADRIEAMQNTINRSIETASNAGELNKKTVPATTAAEADAKAKIALAQSQRLASAADIALSRISVEFNSKKMANDLAIFSATASMTQVQLENSKLAYQAAIDKIRLADSHSQRLLAAANLIEKMGQSEAVEAMLRRYELTMGYAAGSITKAMFNTFSNDHQQNIVAIAGGNGGTNAYEYLKNMEKGRPGPLFSENQKTLARELREMADKIQVPPNITQQVDKDRYIAKELQKRVRQDQELPYSSRLFREITPAEMLRAKQVDPNSDLGKVLATLAQTSAKPSTEMIVQSIMTQFKNPSEAGRVVAEYYKKNISYMNDALNLRFAGIDPLQSYKVLSPVSPLFGKREQFDLTRPDRATQYILTITNEAQAKEMTDVYQGQLRM